MEVTKKIEILERALEREKASRKLAEGILEQKSRELYTLSEELKISNKKLEELLIEKTSALEGVFLNIVDAYVVMDLNGYVKKMNKAAIETLGYDIEKEELRLIDIVDPSYKNKIPKAFKQLTEDGTISDFKVKLCTKKNQSILVHINASLIYNKEGKPIAAQGIFRDITHDTAIKEQIENQRKQLDIIISNSPIGISLSNEQDNKMLMVNEAMCKMLGFSVEELHNIRIKDLTHPDDVPASNLNLDKLHQGKYDVYTMEKRYLKKDGSILWAKTSVSGVRDANGVIKYQVALVEDISEQKRAKEKLEESKNRLESLVLNLQTGILLEDENRKILLANTMFCDMFGIDTTPDNLIGYDCTNVSEETKVIFKNPDNFVKRIDHILQEKLPVYDEELELVDGRYFERSFVPLYSNNKYSGHLWRYRDVTNSINQKNNLESLNTKYSSILANMNLGLIEVDNDDLILMANQSFCDMTEYPLEELIGRKAATLLLYEDDKEIIENKNQKRKVGISDSYEIKIKTKSGIIKHWLISGAPNYNEKGEVIGSIGVHLDITNQKELEAQRILLLKSLEEQNIQLNEYAHMVSHDLKSPLRSISALLSWTIEDFNEKIGKESLQNLNLIQDKVEKMDKLIEGILNYSSLDLVNNNLDNVDLNEVIRNILSIIYIPNHFEIKLLKQLPVIKSDVSRMQQLFQNLISNAINYNDKEKGLIEIDYEDTKNYHIFSIKDNGIGISQEYHDKIFKIFNSLGTKENSTGIGLSIVKKIVEMKNGKIWIDSEVGKGTTFYFSFKK